MITVRCTYGDGDIIVTRINATLDEARAYFLGRWFNIGSGPGGQHAMRQGRANRRAGDRLITAFTATRQASHQRPIENARDNLDIMNTMVGRDLTTDSP